MGKPNKQRNYWTIPIYELVQGGRKILRGEVSATMTLAGLVLELDNRHAQSPIATEAWQRLNRELSISLGNEPLGDDEGVVIATNTDVRERNDGVTAGAPEKLSGSQFEQVVNALTAAFTSSELGILVRVHLDENIDTIASGENLTVLVSNLIGWAERKGKLPILLRGAIERNPTNPEIIRMSKQLGLRP